MSYQVYFVIHGKYESLTHYDVAKIDVKQNHLFLYDKLDNILAVYQSGWWIKAVKIEYK